jgi:hypothetical protein
MKHLEYILEIYLYSHCNICNILIYFCNIDIKHLQHTSETFETLETYVCNMHFLRNMSLLLWQMKAHRCMKVELTGGTELNGGTQRAG